MTQTPHDHECEYLHCRRAATVKLEVGGTGLWLTYCTFHATKTHHDLERANIYSEVQPLYKTQTTLDLSARHGWH